MKKHGLIAIACVVSLIFAGCSKEADSNSVEEIVVDETTSNVPTTEETLMSDSELETEESTITPNGILDLTRLSSTVVYSEVYNMMMTPENYLGTTVKMGGQCVVYQDPNSGKVYYSCIVKDATQCCAQGIEFTLDADEYSADDYPENGEDVVVTGTFSTYMEGDNRYMNLENSTLE